MFFNAPTRTDQLVVFVYLEYLCLVFAHKNIIFAPNFMV